jgi:peptidoglycan/xylan/chitin deacetylase (PgdA/CDA1 family)
LKSISYKRFIGKIIPLKKTASRKVILAYHAVGDSPFSIPLHQFKEQMKWLNENASIVSIDQILKASDAERLNVCLTFDDGYACLMDTVSPILEEYNFPAIVYVNSGVISEDNRVPAMPERGYYSNEPFLSWADIQELTVKNWTLGSHNHYHVNMTQLPVKDLEYQVSISKHEIESRLNRACDHFCYPWGLFNKEIISALQKAGYRHAVTTIHAPLRRTDSPYLIPRLNIQREYSLDDFKSVVLGHWDFIGLVHKFKNNGILHESSY